jgi:hypothetical protein
MVETLKSQMIIHPQKKGLVKAAAVVVWNAFDLAPFAHRTQRRVDRAPELNVRLWWHEPVFRRKPAIQDG